MTDPSDPPTREARDLASRLEALSEAQRAAILLDELERLGPERLEAALGGMTDATRDAVERARRAGRDVPPA